jgi:hypothetical protein
MLRPLKLSAQREVIEKRVTLASISIIPSRLLSATARVAQKPRIKRRRRTLRIIDPSLSWIGAGN